MAAQRRSGGKFAKEEAEEIRDTAKKFSIESFQQNIAKSQSEAISALSGVQQQVLNASNELEKIQRAIEVEKQEQERLHSVAAIAKEVEEAELDRDQRKAELEREAQSFELELSDKKSAAERAHAEAIRLQAETLERTEKKWRFDFDSSKANEQALWDEAKRRRSVEETLRSESVERGFQERDAALAARENELVELKAKVEAFPAEIDKATKREVAIVSNSLNKDHRHEIEMLTGKFNSEKTISENTISSLRADLAGKDKTIAELQLRLTASEDKVSTIATKALETAGNVKALADVQTSAAIASNNGSKRI